MRYQIQGKLSKPYNKLKIFCRPDPRHVNSLYATRPLLFNYTINILITFKLFNLNKVQTKMAILDHFIRFLNCLI